MNCLLRNCFERDQDEQHEDSYEPPRPMIPARMARSMLYAGGTHTNLDADDRDDTGEDEIPDCCRPAEDSDQQDEQSSLQNFWKNLRDQWRKYESLEHVSEDGRSSLAPSAPPPTGRDGPFGRMFRRTDSVERAEPKSLDSDAPPKQTNSPFRAAVSFDETSQYPAINPEEIVLPGSKLQKLMAAHMAQSMEEMGDECVICMEGFDATNPRMPTLCGCGENRTYFHLPCLYQWIEQNRNCPSCRKRLRWEEF